jgi:ATP-dependent DNA ligase
VACFTQQAVKRPAAFIHPCQPIAANHAPSGPDWAHELKHDGYRLQIHVYERRVSLYTINGANSSKRYPLIVRDAARIEGSAIIDAEVVWFDSEGTPDFDVLYSGVNDGESFCMRVRSSDAEWRGFSLQALCGPQSSVAKACAARSRHPVRRARRRSWRQAV